MHSASLQCHSLYWLRTIASFLLLSSRRSLPVLSMNILPQPMIFVMGHAYDHLSGDGTVSHPLHYCDADARLSLRDRSSVPVHNLETLRNAYCCGAGP